jgi:hypothetical protein
LGGVEFKASLGKNLARATSQPITGQNSNTSHLSYMGNINRKITVQASSGKKIQDIIPKITKVKGAWGMIQVVEHLLRKC